MYDNCGLQYLLGVVLGLDPESSHNMAFGSWIHKIFEELETGAIPCEPQAAFARYEELFDWDVFPNRAVARQFHRDGQIMITRYGNRLNPGKALRAETDFRVELDGHRITGRIDRIDKKGSNVIVSDYKTSRHPVQYDEARESLQLAIYYLAATTDPELRQLGEPASMQLIYPASLSRGDVAKRCQTPEEAKKAIERLPALMEGVLAEDFRPDPEADCQWCKFKPLCPLWSEGKELPA
jgi:RecB family exonuclease